MKIQHFQQQLSTTLNHPSSLIISLRHGKIMINTLLRWCSVSLIFSFLLTVTAGIYFCNQIALSLTWAPNLIIGLFLLLFISLLYVQNRYSERRTENWPVSDNDLQVNSFYLQNHYKTNKRRIGIYVITIFAAWLIMTGNLVSHRQTAMSFLVIMGLALYGFGLFMIRNLLKEKCVLRQRINKLDHFKMGINTTI